MSNIDYKTAYTPYQIAEENKLLNVPIYQRLFVWEEEQINLLLDDLYNNFFDKEKSCIRTPVPPYYIGIITVVKKLGKWDIVDGQQRLTFLSLFGAYCRAKNPDSEWKNFLYSENNELRINYMGRPEDKEDLKKIAEGGTDIANRNFRMFSECMKKIFQNSILEGFVDYVYNHASFLITELPVDYEAQDLNLFFEKMNATGKQLTAVEQIKGKYFPAHAAEFDDCLNFEKGESQSNQRMSLWYILNRSSVTVKEEDNTVRNADSASSSILTPEVFLLHCLEILEQKDMPRDERKVLETFKNHVASDVPGKISPSTLLKTMKTYRQWLDENIIYLKASADGSWEYTFRSEDDKENQREYEDQAEKESDKNVNIRLKLKQFQSMLYVSSSNYQEWVLDAYFETTKTEPEKFSLKLLKDQDAKRHVLNENAMTYQSIDRYWFWKLDYLLWEKFMDSKEQPENYNLSSDEKSAIRNYKFRRNRSIEHLHPQTDGDIAEWQEAKHQFGNLAMISSSFNSLQQKDSVGVKFARLRDTQIPQKNLESIKLLLMFKCAGGSESEWTVKAPMRDYLSSRVCKKTLKKLIISER